MSLYSRYFRHGLYPRLRYRKELRSYLDAVSTALDMTGASNDIDPVRTTNTKAENLLTITAAANGNVVTIGGVAYTFKTALTEAPASDVLTASDVPLEDEVVGIGALDYTFKDALTEVSASGDLVTDNTNAADGSSVVIGSKTYTFQDTLTNVDGNIHIGADADATLLNLARAINASGGTPGTDYATANTVHPTVSASGSVTSHTITLTAKTPGVAGNAIVTTASTSPDSHIDPEAGTLAGGVDPVAGEVFIGMDENATLDNLAAAINGDAGEGSLYSTGTEAVDGFTATVGTTDLTLTADEIGEASNGVVLTAEGDLAWAEGETVDGADAVPYEVVVGNGTTEARDNLIDAINADEMAEGITYATGTVEHSKVVASAASGNVLVTAKETSNLMPGFSIPCVETGGQLAWTWNTLQGPMWTATAHNFTDGEGPVRLSSAGTLPAGASATQDLWVHVISDALVAFATSKEALSKGNYLRTTDAGTGAHAATRTTDAQAVFNALKSNNSRAVAAEDDIDDLN